MTVFTQKMLAESLKEILEDKSLDQITIKELTEKCGVSRNTFYYHFHDIYELLEWIFVNQAEMIIKEYGSLEEWSGGVTSAMEYIYENKNMIYHIYNSINRENLEKYLYDVLGSTILMHVQDKARNMDVPEEDTVMISDIMKYALVGWVLQWIGDGMQRTPDQAISKLNSLLTGTMDLVLGNSQRAAAE